MGGCVDCGPLPQEQRHGSLVSARRTLVQRGSTLFVGTVQQTGPKDRLVSVAFEPLEPTDAPLPAQPPPPPPPRPPPPPPPALVVQVLLLSPVDLRKTTSFLGSRCTHGWNHALHVSWLTFRCYRGTHGPLPRPSED